MQKNKSTRRDFLRQSGRPWPGGAGRQPSVAGLCRRKQHDQDRPGGLRRRGTGAALNALSTTGPDEALGHGRRLPGPHRRKLELSAKYL